MKLTLHKKYQNLFKDLSTVRYIVISGGRGSGKSFASSLYLANKFVNSKKNCIYLRQYLTNADSSTIPQFLSQTDVLNLRSFFKIKHGEIENMNGSKLYFKGFKTASNDSDSQLKSIPNLETVLIEEATEVGEKDFDKLNLSVRDKDSSPKIILCLNPSHKKHWIYKRFFERKNVPYNFNGIFEDTIYIHTTFLDNIDHIDETFLKEAEETKKYDILKYNNDFLGMWLDNDYNALWSKELLEVAKDFTTPLDHYNSKYYLGIDIAVSTGQKSDETALTLIEKSNDQYFVLDCIHGKFTPDEWANKCKELKQNYRNLYIVAEKNQGGDLISSTLKHVGINSNIKLVTATKSKILRAEDILILYEQKKVHHTKILPQLETEMLTYSGDPKDKSPNCLDSLVWALKEASQKGNSSTLYIS